MQSVGITYSIDIAPPQVRHFHVLILAHQAATIPNRASWPRARPEALSKGVTTRIYSKFSAISSFFHEPQTLSIFNSTKADKMAFRTLLTLATLGLAAAETTVVNLFIFDADPQSLAGSVVASVRDIQTSLYRTY